MVFATYKLQNNVSRIQIIICKISKKLHVMLKLKFHQPFFLSFFLYFFFLSFFCFPSFKVASFILKFYFHQPFFLPFLSFFIFHKNDQQWCLGKFKINKFSACVCYRFCVCPLWWACTFCFSWSQERNNDGREQVSTNVF